MLPNLGLFLNRKTLTRILFMHELYQKALPVHGIIVEFGVRWGRNLALYTELRGIYEPYNYSRKIVGFDTFSGFPSVAEKDGTSSSVAVGNYSVSQKYEAYLDGLLTAHEQDSPLNHLKKFELIQGDATQTFKAYLEAHPETIVALAYFDFDIYQPTKECLSLLKDHLTKGSVIGFDELNYADFPGETLALKEVFGLDRYAIKRFTPDPLPSYIVID